MTLPQSLKQGLCNYITVQSICLSAYALNLCHFPFPLENDHLHFNRTYPCTSEKKTQTDRKRVCVFFYFYFLKWEWQGKAPPEGNSCDLLSQARNWGVLCVSVCLCTRVCLRSRCKKAVLDSLCVYFYLTRYNPIEVSNLFFKGNNRKITNYKTEKYIKTFVNIRKAKKSWKQLEIGKK